MGKNLKDDLYSEILVVSKNTLGFESEVMRLNLKINVFLQTGSTLKTTEIFLRITDPADALFLLTSTLTESDYQNLRSQQGLLVDFSAFPQKLIELLRHCQTEQTSEKPRFILRLTTSNDGFGLTSLHITETNPFKHLDHLTLQMCSACDQELKDFLSSELSLAKNEISQLRQRMEANDSSYAIRMAESQKTLESKVSELNTLRDEMNEKITKLTAHFSAETANEKSKHAQELIDRQAKSEKDRRDLEQSHLRVVKQFESKIYELENKNREQADSLIRSDATVRDLSSRVQSAETENQRLVVEVQTLQRDAAVLDDKCVEYEKDLRRHQTRASVLDQDINDKKRLLQQTLANLEQERATRTKLEENISEKDKRIKKLDASVKTLSAEVLKGNEIIQKLQNKIKNYHTKVKLRTKITTEQEKLLNEKDAKLESMKSDLTRAKESVTSYQTKHEELQTKLRNAETELSSCKEKIIEDENVIQWLNRQVTEVQLHKSSDTRLHTRHSSSDTVNARITSSKTGLPTSTQRLPNPANRVSFGQRITYNPTSGLEQRNDQEDCNPNLLPPQPYPQMHSTPLTVPTTISKITVDEPHLTLSASSGRPVLPTSKESVATMLHGPARNKENIDPLDPEFLLPTQSSSKGETFAATTGNGRIPKAAILTPYTPATTSSTNPAIASAYFAATSQ